ncbi:MAG: ComEA family DNA-binding protein [Actinomycetales bacterium]
MDVRHMAGDLAQRLRPERPDPERLQARLDLLAAQWQPAGSEEVPVAPRSQTEEEEADPRTDQARFLRMPRLDRRGWRALVMLLAAAAVVPAWAWWQGRPLPVTPIEGTPAVAVSAPFGESSWAAATPAVVVVHVIGAVRKPGLVRLATGARVDDAIAAAGGAKSAKVLASVNLARLVVDGEQIVVGAAQGAPAAPNVPGQGTSANATALVSINAATAAQLEGLPGVGPVLAQRIVDWRLSNGPFRSIEELGEVSGIGSAILDQLRSKVTL